MKKMSPGHEREQRLHQRQLDALLLDPAERREAENEIERRGREKRIGRIDVHRAQVEHQRKAEQQRAADRAEQADDPQDPPRRAGDQFTSRVRCRRSDGRHRIGCHASHGGVGRKGGIIGVWR